MAMIADYLNSGAEPDALESSTILPSGRAWSSACVVPSAGEDPEQLEQLSACLPESVLLVLVVNETRASNPQDRAANDALLRLAGAQNVAIVQLGALAGKPAIVVDRTHRTSPLPLGGGVGLARKLGLDIAMCLRHEGRLCSSWAHMCDADTTLPQAHFQDPEQASLADDVAWVRLTEWHGDDESLVELHCQHQAALLLWALQSRAIGSPWALPVSGNAMSLRYEALAAVGGMPTLAWGEDTALLHRLGLVGAIVVAPVPAAASLARSRTRCVDPCDAIGRGVGMASTIERMSAFQDVRCTSSAAWPHLRAWYEALRILSVEPVGWGPARLAKAACEAAGEGDVGVVEQLIVRCYGPLERGLPEEPRAALLELHSRFGLGAMSELVLELSRLVPPEPIAQAILHSPWHEALGEGRPWSEVAHHMRYALGGRGPYRTGPAHLGGARA